MNIVCSGKGGDKQHTLQHQPITNDEASALVSRRFVLHRIASLGKACNCAPVWPVGGRTTLNLPPLPAEPGAIPSSLFRATLAWRLSPPIEPRRLAVFVSSSRSGPVGNHKQRQAQLVMVCYLRLVQQVSLVRPRGAEAKGQQHGGGS